MSVLDIFDTRQEKVAFLLTVAVEVLPDDPEDEPPTPLARARSIAHIASEEPELLDEALHAARRLHEDGRTKPEGLAGPPWNLGQAVVWLSAARRLLPT